MGKIDDVWITEKAGKGGGSVVGILLFTRSVEETSGGRMKVLNFFELSRAKGSNAGRLIMSHFSPSSITAMIPQFALSHPTTVLRQSSLHLLEILERIRSGTGTNIGTGGEDGKGRRMLLSE